MPRRQFEPDRAIEIITPCYGTAYRIGGRLALTCRHLFLEDEHCRVRSKWPHNPYEEDAKVVWKSPSFDIALIELPEKIDPCDAIIFGDLPKRPSSQTLNFDMYGWPKWARTKLISKKELAGGRQVDGKIYLSDLSGENLLVLKPNRIPEQFSQNSSPWEGMSGAAVVCDGRVIAVQRQHQNPSEPAALEAESLTHVYADFDWQEQLKKHGIPIQPEKIEEPQQKFLRKDDGRLSSISEKSGIDYFRPYLQSLIVTYEQWRRRYTPTDATYEVKDQEILSIFDSGLMVELLPQNKDSSDISNSSYQENSERTKRLPVLDGLRKYADKHVLLVGRPGSGKSTALIRLLLDMAKHALNHDTGQIPILIELRYGNNDPFERIRAFLHKHDSLLTLDKTDLTELLQQGRFLLLVDGLNELPSEKARSQLSTFRHDHPKVPMIFTTRDLSLGGDLGVEKKLEMQPLTEVQMNAFIHAHVPEKADVMLRQLNDRLQEFGQTPLLLWMLCEVFQHPPNHQIPSNLADVFQQFTAKYEDSSRRTYEVAPLKGDVRPLTDRRLWKKALQALASVMMEGETPVDFRVAAHRDEAEREIGRIFPHEQFPVRDILDDLLKFHLLQTRSAGQIEFHHQLIQEYYAAEHLLSLLQRDKVTDLQLKQDYLNYLKWTEPIALMMSLIREASLAVRVVKCALDVDLELGARLAGETSPKIQEKTIKLVEDSKISKVHRFGLFKFQAYQNIPQWLKIHLLAKSKSEYAIPSLLRIIETTDSNELNQQANNALHDIVTGRICSKNTFEKLISLLREERDDLRKIAANLLMDIAGYYPSLIIRILSSDSPEKVLSLASEKEELHKIPGLIRAYFSELFDVENKDFIQTEQMVLEPNISELVGVNSSEQKSDGNMSNSHYRQRLFSSLDNFRQTCLSYMIPSLLEGLDSDNSLIHDKAVYLLKKINLDESYIGLFFSLEHPNYTVRFRASNALKARGADQVFKALKVSGIGFPHHILKSLIKIFPEWLLEKSDSEMLEALDRTLTFHFVEGQESSVKRRFNCFSSSGEFISLFLETFQEFDEYKIEHGESEKYFSQKFLNLLLKAVEDEDQYIRLAAIKTLGELKVDSTIVIEVLLQTLTDKNYSVRNMSSKVLKDIGSDAVVFKLFAILKSQTQQNLHETARGILRDIGCKSISIFLKTIKDPDWTVRINSVYLIGDIYHWYGGGDRPTEIVISALTKAIEDEDYLVRAHAAFSLGEIRSDKAVPILIKALSDIEFYVRKNAASALGKIGSSKAIPALIEAITDSFLKVHINAIYALGEIGSDESVPILLKVFEILKGFKDEKFKKSLKGIAYSLGKIGSSEAVPLLIKAVRDKDFEVRKSVVFALGEIRQEEAVPVLIKATKDKQLSVRKEAINALGKIASNKSVSVLLKATEDKDKDTRHLAVSSLGRIKGDSAGYALPKLVSLLSVCSKRESTDIMDAIRSIQGNCKYYNYSISRGSALLNLKIYRTVQ